MQELDRTERQIFVRTAEPLLPDEFLDLLSMIHWEAVFAEDERRSQQPQSINQES